MSSSDVTTVTTPLDSPAVSIAPRFPLSPPHSPHKAGASSTRVTLSAVSRNYPSPGPTSSLPAERSGGGHHGGNECGGDRGCAKSSDSLTSAILDTVGVADSASSEDFLQHPARPDSPLDGRRALDVSAPAFVPAGALAEGVILPNFSEQHAQTKANTDTPSPVSFYAETPPEAAAYVSSSPLNDVESPHVTATERFSPRVTSYTNVPDVDKPHAGSMLVPTTGESDDFASNAASFQRAQSDVPSCTSVSTRVGGIGGCADTEPDSDSSGSSHGPLAFPLPPPLSDVTVKVNMPRTFLAPRPATGSSSSSSPTPTATPSSNLTTPGRSGPGASTMTPPRASVLDGGASPDASSSTMTPDDQSTSSQVPNVYINGLPPHFPETELLKLCVPYGSIKSVRTFTRCGERSSGYGFVLFDRIEDAERCIEKLKRYKNLHPSLSKQMHKIPGTTYERGEELRGDTSSDYSEDASLSSKSMFRAKMEKLHDRSSTNLYIEGLPLSIDEPTLAALVQPYIIKSSRFFQTKLSHPPRIIAFVRLETRTAAEEIIERLHGRMVRGWNDAGSRISVRFADNSEQRELRRTERVTREGHGEVHSPAKLTMAQAALLNMRGQELQRLQQQATLPLRDYQQYSQPPMRRHPYAMAQSHLDLDTLLAPTHVADLGYRNRSYLGLGQPHPLLYEQGPVQALNGYTPTEELILRAHAGNRSLSSSYAGRGPVSFLPQMTDSEDELYVPAIGPRGFRRVSAPGYQRHQQQQPHQFQQQRSHEPVMSGPSSHVLLEESNPKLPSPPQVLSLSGERVLPQHTTRHSLDSLPVRHSPQQSQQLRSGHNTSSSISQNSALHIRSSTLQHLPSPSQRNSPGYRTHPNVANSLSNNSSIDTNNGNSYHGINNHSQLHYQLDGNHHNHHPNASRNNNHSLDNDSNNSSTTSNIDVLTHMHAHTTNPNLTTTRRGEVTEGDYHRKQEVLYDTMSAHTAHSSSPNNLQPSQDHYHRAPSHQHLTTTTLMVGGEEAASPALTYSSRTPSTLSPATPFFGSFGHEAFEDPAGHAHGHTPDEKSGKVRP